MKQYDFVRAWKNDASYDIEGPVILLTIEELGELWDAAQDSLADDAFGIKNATRTIGEYLTSKGITMP